MADTKIDLCSFAAGKNKYIITSQGQNITSRHHHAEDVKAPGRRGGRCSTLADKVDTGNGGEGGAEVS